MHFYLVDRNPDEKDQFTFCSGKNKAEELVKNIGPEAKIYPLSIVRGKDSPPINKHQMLQAMNIAYSGEIKNEK